MSLMATLLLSLLMPSFLFRQRPLFSTSFTSLTVYFVGFAGYMRSHKEVVCSIINSKMMRVDVKYLVLEQGIYDYYGK
jgi:hypothetical protein